MTSLSEHEALLRDAAQRALAEFCHPTISVTWNELQQPAKDKWLRIAKAALDALPASEGSAAAPEGEQHAVSIAGSGWRPIETAPKDGSRTLLRMPDGFVVFGRWDDDRYAKKPRPYWDNERDSFKTMARECQPEWWLPLDALPPPPTQEGSPNDT